jgi:hypothetical protein
MGMLIDFDLGLSDERSSGSGKYWRIPRLTKTNRTGPGTARQKAGRQAMR